jgi:hypothetical protein
LVAMDPFRNSYVGTDLASLYYVTFIKPLANLPMEALSLTPNNLETTS